MLTADDIPCEGNAHITAIVLKAVILIGANLLIIPFDSSVQKR